MCTLNENIAKEIDVIVKLTDFTMMNHYALLSLISGWFVQSALIYVIANTVDIRVFKRRVSQLNQPSKFSRWYSTIIKITASG